VGRDEDDFARQRRAMERLCAERGWSLAALVKERNGPPPKLRRRPGLAHVLGQVATGSVSQLLIGRLEHVASSPSELSALLAWCARRDVGVVALDVGLDTSTADGRLAARCLGAVAGPPVRRHPAGRPSNGNGHGHANGNGSRRTSGVR
jgi:DNA invertase Pin-like site-specific DNA recombinase